MTIRMLKPWNGYQPDQILSFSTAEETRLVGLGLADYDLDGAADALELVKAQRTLTGGINFSAGGTDCTSALSFGRRKGRAFRGTYGRRVALWSGASLQSSQGTAALVTPTSLPPLPDGSTKVLRLTQNAAQSYGQQICETADYTPSGTTTVSVGIWVNNPSGASLSARADFFNASGSRSFWFYYTVDPTNGWQFLTLSPKSKAGDIFTWPEAVHYVRVGQRDAGGDTWPAGATCDFGPVYLDTKARPRFIISVDDGTSTVYHPGNITAGWPASGRSFREIVEYYGFKGTAYIIPSLIGTNGYLTRQELLELYGTGWTIGSHSWSHPTGSTDIAGSATGTGLRLLGPYGYSLLSAPHQFTASQTGILCTAANDDSAIYSDVMRGITELGALGIPNPDRFFALPQGAWDASVRSALVRSGVKYVRAISSPTNFHSLTIGRPVGGGNSGSSLNPGGWIHQGDAVQTDGVGTPTLGDVTGYVDDCITYGATGSNYHHGMMTANAAVLDGLCSYLKTKQLAGLIDVVTAEQAAWDDGLI